MTENSLAYNPSPEKSYIIEPHGKSLNYDLVKKDPHKFYDQFMDQDLTKHTIGKDKDMLE